MFAQVFVFFIQISAKMNFIFLTCFKSDESELVQGSTQLASFSCRQTTVYLESNSTTTIQINFLPFSVGNKFAVLLLSSQQIGEFLYTIDAKAKWPLPTSIPFTKEDNTSRIPDPTMGYFLFLNIFI